MQIKRVLDLDSRTSEGAKSVQDVIRKMKAIDLSNCPSDFNQAYVVHIGAWEGMRLVESEASKWSERYDSGGAFVSAFIRGMVCDFGMVKESEEAKSRILEMNQRASDDIRRTFTEVKRIAVGYGVTAP